MSSCFGCGEGKHWICRHCWGKLRNFHLIMGIDFGAPINPTGLEIMEKLRKVFESQSEKRVVSLRALEAWVEKHELRIERQEFEENDYPIVFEGRRLAMLGDGDFVINKKNFLKFARGCAGEEE